MSTVRHPSRTDDSTCSDGERYGIVVITKAEGMEVVLHGLRRERAERIVNRKNRVRDEATNVHLVREDELERRENQLKHLDSD